MDGWTSRVLLPELGPVKAIWRGGLACLCPTARSDRGLGAITAVAVLRVRNRTARSPITESVIGPL